MTDMTDEKKSTGREPNAAEKILKSQNPNITRKEARQYKEMAVEFEKTNKRCIFIYPLNGDLGWYEMGDHSALFYKYLVCKPKGIKIDINDDSDSYYGQFEIGRVRSQSIMTVTRRIEESGLFLEQVKKGNLIYYMLKAKMKNAAIDELIAEEAAVQERLNRVMKVVDLDPVFDALTVENTARLWTACRKHMDMVSAASSGVRIMNLCADIRKKYFEMCEPPKKSNTVMKARWKEIRKLQHDLRFEVNVVVGMKIWKRHKIVTLLEKMQEAEERVDARIASLERKMRKKSGSSESAATNRGNQPTGAEAVADDRAREGVREGAQGQDKDA